MLKESTGLRNAMLVTGSLKSVMDGGFIKIYAGTIPETADAALDSATLLRTVTVDGDGVSGLTLGTVATNGQLPKNAAETWKGTNVATGLATFYRHVTASDDGTLSTTQARIQGKVAEFGAEMNLANPTLTSGIEQELKYYLVALPTL